MAEILQNPLLAHAVKNSWINPQIDRQFIVGLARRSRPLGDINYLDILGQRQYLPNSKDRFHVFEIGRNHPQQWNLANNYITPVPFEYWVKASEISAARNLVLNFYNDAGFQFPLQETWIKLGQNQSILIAVRKLNRLRLAYEDRMFMRCYTNAYYSYQQDSATPAKIQVFGGEVVLVADALPWQTRYHQLQAGTGYAQAFLNGVLVADIAPSTLTTGDYIEIVYDPSVKRVDTYGMQNLPSFYSAMDSKRKYLVHPPKSAGVEVIDYLDDIDFWIVDQNGKGLYYHKNQADAVRMVTHRDYALPTAYVGRYAQAFADWVNNNNLSVRMVVRNPGWVRNQGYEHNRLRELYKLSDVKIVRALLGMDAVLPEWQASNLEASPYQKLIRTRYQDITRAQVAEAYGYNAMTLALNTTPVQIGDTEQGRGFILPSSCWFNATVYEYDQDGLLLGFYTHATGENYLPVNSVCVLIEPRAGKASRDLSTTLGVADVKLDINYGFRAYVASYNIDTQQPVGKWKDVTGSNSYSVSNGVLKWNIDSSLQIGLVITNDTFLGYSFTLENPDHTLTFSLTETWQAGGVEMAIPPGDVDIWMGDGTTPLSSLIQGLDYILDFPKVYILNKQYLSQGDKVSFVVRCSGFANADGTMQTAQINDNGWVDKGVLSYNDTWNLRDDRATRCIVGGKLYRREQLVFAEGDAPPFDQLNGLNGQPYQVTSVIAELKYVEDYQSETYRAKSQDLDTRLSNYLTTVMPQTQSTLPSTQADKYLLYSPFLCKLINDIALGVFVVPASWESEDRINQLIKGYLWWLKYDPIVLGWNSARISVQPHNLNRVLYVSANAYKFLNQVIRLYLDNKVSLTGAVEIQT